MMTTPVTWAKDLLALFYPNLCLACERNTPVRDHVICLPCQHYLPKTKFHLEPENAFTEKFWGRVRIHSGAALYYFKKGSRTQNLIHKLKYEGKTRVGIKLGQLYGRMLKSAPAFEPVQLILPVPLHPKKQHQRGYNQSDLFALGLSQEMGIPWQSNVLIRRSMTDTQTRKSRSDRIANVQSAFAVKRPAAIAGKHILLVDDVLTTGATLEACAQPILAVKDTKLSLATIAMASTL